MKKVIISLGLIGLVAMLVLNSCTKTNVKYGNKRIIGTWKMTSDNSDVNSTIKTTTTYDASSCNYENTTSESVSNKKIEQTGHSIHKVETIKNTENGQTTTTSTDTTYTKENDFEITFNEDGTCSLKTSSEYEYSNTTKNETITGHWSWVDSYKEKAGISIYFNYGNVFFEESTMFIESLSKDELIFNYDLKTNSTETTENTTYCYTDNKEVKYTTVETKNTVATGSRVMKK